MSAAPAGVERLQALTRVAGREAERLVETSTRLFAAGVDRAALAALAQDPLGSERIEAFAARFGRLQDTLGARLLPALLAALGEPVRSMLDNLDRAERLSWIEDAAGWQALRMLRNRLVPEYVDSVDALAAALLEAHAGLPILLRARTQMHAELADRGWSSQPQG